MENINTPEQAISYAVDLNFKGIQAKAVENYGITGSIVSTPAELKSFLLAKYNMNQLNRDVFRVPVDTETEGGKSMARLRESETGKPFSETFVGSLISTILFPDQQGGEGNGGGGIPVSVNHGFDTTQIVIVIVAVVGSIILVGTALYFFTRKKG